MPEARKCQKLEDARGPEMPEARQCQVLDGAGCLTAPNRRCQTFEADKCSKMPSAQGRRMLEGHKHGDHVNTGMNLSCEKPGEPLLLQADARLGGRCSRAADARGWQMIKDGKCPRGDGCSRAVPARHLHARSSQQGTFFGAQRDARNHKGSIKCPRLKTTFLSVHSA